MQKAFLVKIFTCPKEKGFSLVQDCHAFKFSAKLQNTVLKSGQEPFELIHNHLQ